MVYNMYNTGGVMSEQVDVVNVLQFGEGNFLRGFFDWAVNNLQRNGDCNVEVSVVAPIDSNFVIDLLNQQDGNYNVILEGLVNGQAHRQIDQVNVIKSAHNAYTDWNQVVELAENPNLRIIVSNTTEAGIAYNSQDKFTDQPPQSFPAKLTYLLYQRFGAGLPGVIVLPCELIEFNGAKLREFLNDYAVLWNLGQEFTNWLNSECIFYNTLVDRIVPGYPKNQADQLAEEIGYQDQLMVKAEPFGFFGLELVDGQKFAGRNPLEEVLPLTKSGLNILYTDNLRPYRERKVHLLNGPHTAMAVAGLLAGIETVDQAVNAPNAGCDFQELMFSEIIPVLDLPEDELKLFANQVLDRFKNPYNKHNLSSIVLNSVAKYRTRLLPILKRYEAQFGKIPPNTANALACLIQLYRGEDTSFDNVATFDYIKHHTVQEILGNTDFWGEDLTQISGLVEHIENYISSSSR
jgi:tagaturonate reductase